MDRKNHDTLILKLIKHLYLDTPTCKLYPELLSEHQTGQESVVDTYFGDTPPLNEYTYEWRKHAHKEHKTGKSVKPRIPSSCDQILYAVQLSNPDKFKVRIPATAFRTKEMRQSDHLGLYGEFVVFV